MTSVSLKPRLRGLRVRAGTSTDWDSFAFSLVKAMQEFAESIR